MASGVCPPPHTDVAARQSRVARPSSVCRLPDITVADRSQGIIVTANNQRVNRVAYNPQSVAELREAAIAHDPSRVAPATLAPRKFQLTLANQQPAAITPGALLHAGTTAGAPAPLTTASAASLPVGPPPLGSVLPPRFTPAPDNIIPLVPTTTVQPQAPQFPDLSGPRRRNATQRNLEKAMADADTWQHIEAQVAEDVSRALDTTNPFTRRHIQQTLVNWTTLIGRKYPNRQNDYQLWESAVILSEARTYLSLRVRRDFLPHLPVALILSPDPLDPWPQQHPCQCDDPEWVGHAPHHLYSSLWS